MNYFNDTDHFQSHSWGYLSWEAIYNCIDNALDNKGKKLKNNHLANSNHKIERYNYYGFSHDV